MLEWIAIGVLAMLASVGLIMILSLMVLGWQTVLRDADYGRFRQAEEQDYGRLLQRDALLEMQRFQELLTKQQ